MSPSEYAKSIRRNLIVAAKSDAVNVDLRSIDTDVTTNVALLTMLFTEIPYRIPAKYHKLLREIFITVYLNTLFKHMSSQLTMTEKHRIINRTLCRIKC